MDISDQKQPVFLVGTAVAHSVCLETNTSVMLRHDELFDNCYAVQVKRDLYCFKKADNHLRKLPFKVITKPNRWVKVQGLNRKAVKL